MEELPKELKELDAASMQWQSFDGIKNSKDVLSKKASALAHAMTSLLAQSMESLQSILSFAEIEANDERWWSIYYDLLLFFMHIADREAFEYLEKNRGIFVKRLLKEVAQICCKDFENDKQAAEFRKNFASNFVLFQKEFAVYERGQTDYLTENLNYQFTNRILRRLKLDEDVALIFKLLSLTIAYEVLLNIPRLLDDNG